MTLLILSSVPVRLNDLMPLTNYKQKRNFAKTSEPKGRVKTSRGKVRAYVVQKHAASRLHYDFRLECDGVLLSWAVPKGPSLDPSQKRLAVHVEDHPLEYGSFEGSIPKGEYGGGEVIVWDHGTWEEIPGENSQPGVTTFKFTLHGQKLRGKWALVRMAPRETERQQNWLLIKEKDGFCVPETKYSVIEKFPLSTLTKRDLSELAAPSSTTGLARARDKRITHSKPKKLLGASSQSKRNSKAGR